MRLTRGKEEVRVEFLCAAKGGPEEPYAAMSRGWKNQERETSVLLTITTTIKITIDTTWPGGPMVSLMRCTALDMPLNLSAVPGLHLPCRHV